MRTQIVPSIGTITYPDKWCFAYNPQMIIVEAPDIRVVYIYVSDVRYPSKPYILEVALHDGKATADISRALQALTDGVVDKRWSYIHVAVKIHGVYIASFHLYSLYGHIDEGEYFSNYGEFEYSAGQAYFKRRVVWFKNYPFWVSLFRRSASDLVVGTVDGGTAEDTALTEINLFDIPVSSLYPTARTRVLLECTKPVMSFNIFDDTFDYTFVEKYGSMITERVEVLISTQTEGYYLRWIDKFGYLRFFLFTLNEVEIKATPSSYRIDRLSNYDSSSPISSEVAISAKCSAMNVPWDILQYVSGILSSPIVELYENGIWLPVRVTSGSRLERKKVAQDFEITIERNQFIQLL